MVTPLVITKGQRAKQRANNMGIYVLPRFTGHLSLNPLVVGQVVALSGLTYVSNPAATVSYAITVNGVSQTWPYTIQSGDVLGIVSVTVTLTSLGNVVSSAPVIGTVLVPGLPPDPVSNPLTFTGVGQNGFTVNWTPASTGGTPTSFLVSYRVSGGGSYSAPQSVATNSLVISGLLVSTAYDVQVVASNINGNAAGVVTTQSTAANTATWNSLRYVGGNVLTPTSSMQTPQFFNAVFDSRNFTDQSANPVAKDANGWPAAAWQAVVSAANGATNTAQQPNLKTGSLTLATYNNCLFKTPSGNPCVITCNGGSISNLSLQSDDGTTKTYTFTLSPTANSNVSLNGSQAISFMYIPWDGSTAYNPATNPIWNPVWLAYNGQMDSLRFMDYLNTLDGAGGLSGIGKLGEKTWSDPVTGRVPNLQVINAPHSWETTFGLINAVRAYGNHPDPWINIPGYATTDYATQLATLANAMGMPSMRIELGNEPWNSAYTYLNAYQYLGMQEAQVIANYGNGTIYSGISGTNPAFQITSVTTDASSNVTVTTNGTISTQLPLVKAGLNYTFRFTLGTPSSLWNSVGVPLTSVSGGSFTFPTRGIATFGTITGGSGGTNGTYNNVPLTGGSGALATAKIVVSGGAVTGVTITNAGYGFVVGDSVSASSASIGNVAGFSVLVASLSGPPASSSLTGIFGIQIQLNDTNKVASVTSDGAGNVTVTTNVSLSSLAFSVAVGVKLVANNQQVSTWNAGTLAAPVTISAVTANSFTYPCPTAPANSTMASTNQFACFIGQVASSGVGLDSDLVKCRPAFSAFSLSIAWLVRQTKRLRDAWFAVRTQDKFVINQQAAGLGGSTPQALTMANYFGSQPGSTYSPPASWLYGFTVAPYNSLTSVPANVDAAFAQFTTNLAGSIGQQIEYLAFWSQYFGVTPVVYECGPDIQNAPALQIEISSDSRMQSMITDLMNKIYQAGIHEAHAFQITASPFVENSAQGGWGFQQTITDTVTNYKMLGLLSMLSASEAYANINGTAPCVFPIANAKLTTSGSKNTSNAGYPAGIWNWANSGTRDMAWLCCSNSAANFTLTVTGTDSVANTQATINIISAGVTTTLGTVILPQGGAGNSSTCTPSASTALTVAVPKGACIIQISFATGQGTNPGITQVALS